MVQCDRCGKKYESFVQEANQGYGCASEYQKSTNRLFCHYGSRYDLQIWRFTEEVDYDAESNICDDCIEDHINNNELTFVKDVSCDG
jgi:hypothetical protein